MVLERRKAWKGEVGRVYKIKRVFKNNVWASKFDDLNGVQGTDADQGHI